MKKKKKGIKIQTERKDNKIIPTIIRMIFCVGSTSFKMFIQAWNDSHNEFQKRFWATDYLSQHLLYQIYVHNFCLPQIPSSIFRVDCYFKGTWL